MWGCAVICNVSVSGNIESIISKLSVGSNVYIIGNIVSIIGKLSVVITVPKSGNIISIIGKLSVVCSLEPISCKEESIIGNFESIICKGLLWKEW